MAFSLGIYTPQGAFDPTLPPQLQTPGLSLSGPAVLVWHPEIRPPQSVTHIPAASIGTDLTGNPVVRSYAYMTWRYPQVVPDDWYLLRSLYLVCRFGGSKLRIRWPDPESGTTSEASARWGAFSSYGRKVGAIEQVTLTFTHLGIDDASIVGSWLPPMPINN